jgi:hypothetical protein
VLSIHYSGVTCPKVNLDLPEELENLSARGLHFMKMGIPHILKNNPAAF